MHCPEAMAWRIPKPYRRRIPGTNHKYRDSLVEAWHMDKDNADRRTPCDSRFWRFHVHHYYSVKFMPWFYFKRKHFQRCAECGLTESKELGKVNHGYMNGNVHFHSECQRRREARLHSHDPSTCLHCQYKKAGDAVPSNDSN